MRIYRCKGAGESSRRNTPFIRMPGIGKRYFFWPPQYKKERTINIDAGDMEFIHHTRNFKVPSVGKWSNYRNFKTNERSRYDFTFATFRKVPVVRTVISALSKYTKCFDQLRLWVGNVVFHCNQFLFVRSKRAKWLNNDVNYDRQPRAVSCDNARAGMHKLRSFVFSIYCLNKRTYDWLDATW